ncbi:MAG TPA: o-succinylbenzoate--CoA ligase [Nocardioidaceae bacterium]|nr:o-succinylbenzoate--CoA ligase [Nocardioidaceae bacterium]
MPGRPRLSDRFVDVAAAPDAVAAVLDAHDRGDLIGLRTSGTSGGPRSVVRTTASWFDSFDTVSGLLGLDASSRVWVPGPPASTMNLFTAVHAAAMGARLVRSAADASHAVLTPAALGRVLAQGPRPAGVHLLVAGDRLDRALRDRALAAGAARVSHYYGAAELSFVAWGTHADDLVPFPGVEVDTADGQVWVRSPFTFLRYDGPDGSLVRRADGFMTVGDRGLLTDGRLRVLGRGSDAVVSAGTTVLVADVETALEEATGTRPVVVGLPHPDLGQVLCGVAPTAEIRDSLKRAARDLEPAQRPRRWFVVEDLPVTDAGKLDRAALTDRVREAGEGDRRTVDAP